MPAPDPVAEIRIVTLTTLHGANYWSRRPVTRLDLAVGAFDDISSADVGGATEGLLKVLPGLRDHRCSVGRRGGFVARLRQGTYAPHILEHVALELQSMIGHDVGYGRARGGDRRGEYTVVFEHLHSGVGLRTAAHALDLVQAVLAERVPDVGSALAELRALARTPEPATPTRQHVACGVIGGANRAQVRDMVAARERLRGHAVVDVAPGYLLSCGLPYASSDLAVVLDACPVDVPERYRDPALARRLHSVVAEAVTAGGFVVAPAMDSELHRMIAGTGAGLATFSVNGGEAAAPVHAEVRGRQIIVMEARRVVSREPLDLQQPREAQLIAALAEYLIDRGTA
ncbi:MAG: hypothetical protein WD737_07560 [Gemmatimonadota bacterium]